jgi:hypothetical protein
MQILLATTMTLSLLAGAPPEPDQQTDITKAFTAEEKAQMQEQLAAIAKAMGAEDPNRVVPGEAKPRTAVDVADKALDMFGGLVVSISSAMQKAAPEVWRIMIRQQYAKAIADLTTPWMLLMMTLIYWNVIGKKYRKGYLERSQKSYDSDADVANGFNIGLPLIAGGIFCIWGIIAFSASAKYLINPEFYAVRDILVLLINPRQAIM